jgi:hypothetical protein
LPRGILALHSNNIGRRGPEIFWAYQDLYGDTRFTESIMFVLKGYYTTTLTNESYNYQGDRDTY